MTKQELIALCENFKKNDTATFRVIVSEFAKLNPDNMLNLRHGLGYSKSAIRKWISGKSAPSYLSMRQEVVDFIHRRVKRALKIEQNKQTAITCQEIDELFSQTALPPIEEFFKKFRLMEAHILDCPVCRNKYDTLATTADDVAEAHLKKEAVK